MKKHFKIVAIALTCLMSLSTYANPTKDNPEEETVTVHVYRPSAFIGLAWNFNLKVNGEKLQKIKNGNHFVLKFKPGKTTFSIRKSEVIIDLKPDKTYYLRSFIKAGFLIGSINLVEVTEDFALNELNK